MTHHSKKGKVSTDATVDWKWSAEALKKHYLTDQLGPPQEWVKFIKKVLDEDVGIPYFTTYGNVSFRFAWNKRTDRVEKLRDSVRVVKKESVDARINVLVKLASVVQFTGKVNNAFIPGQILDDEDLANLNSHSHGDKVDVSYLVLSTNEYIEGDCIDEYGEDVVVDDDGFKTELHEPSMKDDACLDEFGAYHGQLTPSLENFYWRLLHYYYSGDDCAEDAGYRVGDFCSAL